MVTRRVVASREIQLLYVKHGVQMDPLDSLLDKMNVNRIG